MGWGVGLRECAGGGVGCCGVRAVEGAPGGEGEGVGWGGIGEEGYGDGRGVVGFGNCCERVEGGLVWRLVLSGLVCLESLDVR